MNSATYGIEDINLYAGTCAIHFEEIGKSRHKTQKELNVVGFKTRSVPMPYEDVVTYAVNAATPLLKTIDKKDIYMCIVGTESSLDYGKPISTYVHRHLKLPTYCSNFEVKHACYSGTAALQTAVSALKSGRIPKGKKALVIMSDISRKHFDDPAEITSGSAAVAMIVSDKPDVLIIPGKSGWGSAEVYDVARPTPTGEWGDPVLSLSSYFDLAEMSWDSYVSHYSPQSFTSEFDYMIYHTPLLSIVKQTHHIMLENEDDTIDSAAHYSDHVAPALDYNMLVGNIYSGTIYAALISLIDTRAIKTGTSIGFFSYGSGACSEWFQGIVGPKAKEKIESKRIQENLNSRSIITTDDYETLILESEKNTTLPDYIPNFQNYQKEFDTYYNHDSALYLDKVSNHYHSYKWGKYEATS